MSQVKYTSAKLLFTMLFLMLFSIALAHEFWIEAQHFFFKKGDQAEVSFWVGENFEGEAWQSDSRKLEELSYYDGNLKRNLLGLFKDSLVHPIKVNIEKEGTQMLVLHSNDKYLELDAEKFNAYLEEDGLEEIIELRKKNNQSKQPSRELYRRCAKLLLQVGDLGQDVYLQNTGMPLEIIALQNPYFQSEQDSLEFKIIFHKKILKNQQVFVWHRLDEKTSKLILKTDSKGIIRFKIERKGKWMISTVKMTPHSNPKEADWHSYWGSFTFGYE